MRAGYCGCGMTTRTSDDVLGCVSYEIFDTDWHTQISARLDSGFSFSLDSIPTAEFRADARDNNAVLKTIWNIRQFRFGFLASFCLMR